MKKRFNKILFTFFIISVSVFIYLRHYIHADTHVDFSNIIKISRPPDLPDPDQINVIRIRKEQNNFERGVLRFDNRFVDIFLHGKHDLISQSILIHGTWEAGWINQMTRYLKANPGMQLIDAGCNLGVYTLVAASLGHKVIAIDANKNNTDRLVQSVLLNNLTDRVTIVLNALSNERRTFSMNTIANNVGGQELEETKNSSYRVKSIFFDDLLPLLDRKKDVMMKMDIQYHEIRAMEAASDLFDKTNIKLLLVEWIWLKELVESFKFMSFLRSKGYTAHRDFFDKEELSRSNYEDWPYDVVWRRN